jgi:hypothetical protein
MAAQGTQRRIAIYWVEPELFRESPTFLGCGDFLFRRDSVCYWIYGMSQPVTLPCSEAQRGSLLPQQKSLDSVVRSSLAIVSRVCSQLGDARPSLELASFFREGRDRRNYTQEGPPAAEVRGDPSPSETPDVQALNSLPYGRTYSKEIRDDGTVVWIEKRALNGEPVVSISVKRVVGQGGCPSGSAFDGATLGQWALVSPPYRAYWSFDKAYSELPGALGARIASRDLYEKIGAYLNADKIPSRVRRALERLWFKTALLAEDMDRVQASAQASAAGLCQDDSVGVYPSLLELAGIGGQIEEHYPQQARDWLRPLVEQMVGHFGRSVPEALNEVMLNVGANKWFLFGELLLEEIGRQRLMKEDTLSTLAAKLQATRIAQTQAPTDPCESSATVRRYLAQLDSGPPRGTIDMSDVRHILDKGLAKCYPGDASATKRQLVENVIHLIRLIVGAGPFCGDPAKLAQAVEHFSSLYLGVNKAPQPIDTVLATFLALSFCDTSTAEDHDLLFSQFRESCAELQAQVEVMLNDRGLSPLVTSEDVKNVFGSYERLFRKYVDDPLWPAFKFPLTTSEQTRLAGKLNLRLMQLTPLLDDMSAKVKYGGSSPELKKKTMFEISRAVQQLLPEVAFLREPPYPGILCQYRGGYGFVVVIAGPLYREGDRPKERFRAMKYFHLGHRLQSVVEQERELVSPTRRKEISHEAALPEDVELPSRND